MFANINDFYFNVLNLYQFIGYNAIFYYFEGKNVIVQSRY